MKNFAVLFAVYIFLLSSIPVFELAYSSFPAKEKCSRECCCLKMNKKIPEKKEDPCKGMACNPFQVCCNCSFIATSVSVKKITTETKILTQFASPVFIFIHSSDCWRPPEVA